MSDRLRPIKLAVLLIALIPATLRAQTSSDPIDLKFSFGPRPIQGFTRVQPAEAYNVNRGYGFDFTSKVEIVDRTEQDPLKAGFVTGQDNRAFFFSTRLSPGVYQVIATLGDATAESITTIKSETRRLMFEAVKVPAGQTQTKTFLVHLREPRIAGTGGRMVSLKPRERELILYMQWKPEEQLLPFIELDWDEKLTLEFSDVHPALISIQITSASPQHMRVYLVGDSTMTDQMMEPWAAWGQMFPRFFNPPVVIANYAESGESAASFIGEQRWAKLMSEIRADDYVLIQFGINDRSLAPDQIRRYFTQYIDEARAKGAVPVLVTSQNLRTGAFDAAGKAVNTLGQYPQVMRDIAKEKNAPLIDLNEMSIRLYQTIGREQLPKAFVDATHHNGYGAYQLAKCVVQAAIDLKLPWAEHVVEDWKSFDPSQPDAIDSFKLPVDPQLDPARPGGPGAPGGRGGMAGDAPRGRGGPVRRRGAPAAANPASQPGQ